MPRISPEGTINSELGILSIIFFDGAHARYSLLTSGTRSVISVMPNAAHIKI